MNEKIFCFRWDIDHIKCIEEGVPNILDICLEHNIKCSFFINLGKSMDLKLWSLGFKKSFNKVMDKDSLNVINKLGWFDFLKTLSRNQDVGLSHIKILKRILNEGHDLGLHGGMNHVTWSRNLDKFSIKELDRLLEESIGLYKLRVNPVLEGFVSPGFKSNESLLILLDKYKIKYAGDLSGKEPFYPKINGRKTSCLQIPVTIIGPGTIPILENLYARGLERNEIMKIVKEQIKEKDFAVWYGHPLFEGLKSKDFEEILLYVKEEGYRILTMKEIYEKYKNNAEVKDVAV